MPVKKRLKKGAGVEDLIKIIKKLRSPSGCPWDREQTREKMGYYLIEEAHEAKEAIDGGSPEQIREELGDLLFQLLTVIEISEERGEFTLSEVIEQARDKMVRRHPHVFGKRAVSDADEVVANWVQIKREEKKDGSEGDSIVSGIPKSIPSLHRAYLITQRAARVGFDWEDKEGVLKKLKEEVKELESAVSEGNKEKIVQEMGDLLFSIVNLGRFLEVDPESAVTKAVDRFISRFRYIEQRLKEREKDPSQSTLEEMDQLWEEAKKAGI
ncbi:MAG: nucleoside triphosphate pyrophosphohydrolase [Proteobacteria bacterium]|nr:nucleoside triphosphate pyrophosphohydrolase [Pseudomonadota bacterium]